MRSGFTRASSDPSFPSMRVFIFGAGKLGRALARAAKQAGHQVHCRPARSGMPKKRVAADLIVFAVRDRELTPAAEAWAQAGLVATGDVVVHVAGALGADVLAPLRAVGAKVAQMHPMISFADPALTPPLQGGGCHVAGDAAAVRRARAFAKSVGLVPRNYAGLDTIGYHAAAAFVANGACALAAEGARVLEAAGVPAADVHLWLGPLLTSVGANVQQLGFPHALTGPVRRGDAAAVQKHADNLSRRAPSALPLYRAALGAQVRMAKALGEVPDAALRDIRKLGEAP